ncbi:hypothetical protein [Sorangium sp. So ce854]|uniref:hypothetical protein n=1 Tax=Sorangium sp. So ce854 TaxID=3133322 RepID=UPI003F6268BC
MLHQVRWFLASFVACVTVAGCVMSAEPAGEGDDLVDSVQQPLPSTGYYRTYFSDATFATAVGWENYDCEPEYREFDGERTRYYRQHRYDCPGYDNPLLPSTTCNLCNTYTTSTGQTFTNCSTISCPTQPYPW